MNIAVICPDFLLPKYIASSYVVELNNQVREFAKAGHRVCVLARGEGFGQKGQEGVSFYGLDSCPIPLKKYIWNLFPGIIFPEELIKAISLLRKIKPDCIYSSGTPFWALFPAIIGRLTGIRTVYYIFEPLAYTAWLGADIIKERPGFFAYIRNFIIEGARNSVRQRALIKKALRNVDSLIASSQVVRDSLGKAGFLNIPVIYPGIEIPVKADAYPGDFLITYLGHLRPERGSIDLINAFVKVSGDYKEAKLAIAPSEVHAATRAFYQRLLDKHGLGDRVKRLGVVDDVYKKVIFPSYIIVLPHKDAHSLKLIEVLASGRAVIASDIGWAKEFIRDGVSGLLFKAGDVRELAAKIAFALNNPEKIKEMASLAREQMSEKCDISKNASAIISILQSAAYEKVA